MYHHPKKTLSSGCSFTAGNWEAYLNDHFNHKDLAHPGGGNKYIADSVIHYTNNYKVDCVFVMWSGMTRIDIPVSDSQLIKDNFNNYFPVSRLGNTTANTQYVMSGGEYGNWLNHSIAKQIFSGIYKVMTYQDMALLSLSEIIKLQTHLKLKNIPYYFMSYINYWDRPKDWLSPNCDRGLNNYTDLNSVVSQIDFEPWIFLNNNKDGIYEIAEQSDGFVDDRFHPNPETQKKWFDIVIARVNQDQHLAS